MDIYGYFSTGVIVFDRIFHKIVHSTIQQQVTSGNNAVSLLLDQFNILLFRYGSQVAENLIRQCCQRDPLRNVQQSVHRSYPGGFQPDGKVARSAPGAWQKSPDNLFKAGVSLRAKTSRFVWITARGVLSSWAALAENCFWAVKASSRRASILLNEMVRRKFRHW